MLYKVFEKNKRCFGGSILFDTLNCYIFYGRERFVQDKAAIEMLFRIADITLFTMTPNVIQNNSEGAIFLNLFLRPNNPTKTSLVSCFNSKYFNIAEVL